MSSRSARRVRQQQAKGQSLIPRAFRLGVALHPDAITPPDFGPAKFTPEQQAADPTARMTRVVKPVLRTGDWKAGFDATGKPRVWTVTGDTLNTLVNSFKLMSQRGYQPNLGKGHGDEELQISADDLIAPIDDIRVQGDALWMSAYVTPAEREYLEHPSRKVSVGVVSDYIDGGLQQYPQALLHVAVLDRGAVGGLAPFVALADSAAPSGDSSMNPELLDAINMLMEKAGLGKLGEVADEADLIAQLKGVAAALGVQTTSSEPPPDGGGAPAPELDMSGLPAAMRDPLRKVLGDFTKRMDERDDEIKTLRDSLAARDAADAQAKKAAFDAECVKLQTVPDANGMVAAKADVDQVRALADSMKSTDLRFLSTVKRTIRIGRSVSKANATADPPQPLALGDSITSKETREAAAQRIADLRGIKLEDAMKFLPRVAN